MWLGEPLSYFRIPGGLPVTTGSWYEEREAARFSLYTWSEYQQLDAIDRAGVIAYYRVHNKLQALIDDYTTKQVSANTAKSKGRR